MSDQNLPDLPDDETSRRIAEAAGLFDPDMDFRKLALEAHYYTRGFRLVDKEDLLGVPHVIIGVTYRDGYRRPDDSLGDYVSLEAVCADKATMDARPPALKQMSPGTVWPNEPIVYNDGGTGIRRSITHLLHSIGVINVGPPAEGSDENPFDRPMHEWVSGAEYAGERIEKDANGDPLRYIALRGLRRSDYDSDFGPATTWYFA